MAPLPDPAELRDLVAALYRADWTTVSLSATVTSREDRALRARLVNNRPPWADQVDRLIPGLAGRSRDAAAGWPPGAGPPVTEVTRQVLLAPGGKYRVSDGEAVVAVSDGESAWDIEDGEASWLPPTTLPWLLEDLLSPARLLARFSLDLAGRVEAGTGEAGGRAAYRVLGRPRPLAAEPGARQTGPLDHVDVLVDAELGILLHYEEVFQGQSLLRTTLDGVVAGPPQAADPARFRLPPGISPDGAEPGSQEPGSQEPGSQRAGDRVSSGTPGGDAGDRPRRPRAAAMPGLAGDAVRAAAGVAATGMGFAIRHWPSPPEAGPAGMPPGAVPVPAGPREPPGDDLVNLLHRTALPPPAFSAEAHHWADFRRLVQAAAEARQKILPAALDGILGPDEVWDAAADRAQVGYRAVRLRLAAGGRYRVDMLEGGRNRDPDTTASDGEHYWLVRGGQPRTRRAAPLNAEFARLADPAWLLAEPGLLAAGETEVDGRRGLVLVLRDPDSVWPVGLVGQVEAVLDAALGVLLRVTSFSAGHPVICYEMRRLSPGAPPAEVFAVPPGARRAGPLDGIVPPSPLEAAKGAAGLGLVGAAALAGWLQKRPRSGEDR